MKNFVFGEVNSNVHVGDHVSPELERLFRHVRTMGFFTTPQKMRLVLETVGKKEIMYEQAIGISSAVLE